MTLQSSCSSLILCSVCEVEKAPQQTLNLPVLHLGVPCFQTCELQPAVCKPVCVWQCSHISLNGIRQLATEWWRADHRASLNRCCWYQVHRQEHSPLLLPLALAGQIPCHRGRGEKGGGEGGRGRGRGEWLFLMEAKDRISGGQCMQTQVKSTEPAHQQQWPPTTEPCSFLPVAESPILNPKRERNL